MSKAAVSPLQRAIEGSPRRKPPGIAIVSPTPQPRFSGRKKRPEVSGTVLQLAENLRLEAL